jgi:hypothetical protein
MDQQYIAHANNATTCQSVGGLTRVPNKTPSKQCQALLREAGLEGTGLVRDVNFKRQGVSDQSGSGRLSQATKIAIGISIAILILLAAILYLLYRRRRKRIAGKVENSDKIAELPIKETFEIGGNERSEIAGQQVFEKDEEAILEMPTIHNEPVELDAAQTRIAKEKHDP